MVRDGSLSRPIASKSCVESPASLLPELGGHLRRNHTQRREERARRITEGGLPAAVSEEEIFAAANCAYDNYAEALETQTAVPIAVSVYPHA